MEKDFFVTQTLPIKADQSGGQDGGVRVNVHLKPAPISVVLRPVVGVSKEPQDNVQVALVCSDNSGTGEEGLREVADQVLSKGDPFILKSAAPLDENLDCELEVSGDGLFTHTEPITATLGVESVPVTVQVLESHMVYKYCMYILFCVINLGLKYFAGYTYTQQFFILILDVHNAQ